MPYGCGKQKVEKSISDQEMAKSSMPGGTCLACKNSRTKDPDMSFHRFPDELTYQRKWLRHRLRGFTVVLCSRSQINQPPPFFLESVCQLCTVGNFTYTKHAKVKNRPYCDCTPYISIAEWLLQSTTVVTSHSIIANYIPQPYT